MEKKFIHRRRRLRERNSRADCSGCGLSGGDGCGATTAIRSFGTTRSKRTTGRYGPVTRSSTCCIVYGVSLNKTQFSSNIHRVFCERNICKTPLPWLVISQEATKCFGRYSSIFGSKPDGLRESSRQIID